MTVPRPDKGSDQAALDAFMKGQSNSVTYSTHMGGNTNASVTVTITRP